MPHAVGPENENIACDFFLAFSPEREDPGNKQYGWRRFPRSSAASTRPVPRGGRSTPRSSLESSRSAPPALRK